MITYIRVQWEHDSLTNPVWLYSELDYNRWETRKVEIFRDHSYGYASKAGSKGPTQLGLVPIPSLEEIARDDQFKPSEITQDKFEDVWERALILTK